MGLLKGVVLLPLAPLSGLRWLAEVLGEEAERGRAAEQSPERARSATRTPKHWRISWLQSCSPAGGRGEEPDAPHDTSQVHLR
jgi:hypothetical protein